MTVTYETRIVACCPVDGTLDVYDLTVESDDMIPAENILDWVKELTVKPVYQEDLTKYLQEHLGGKVTTVGTHSGVRTVAVAP